VPALAIRWPLPQEVACFWQVIGWVLHSQPDKTSRILAHTKNGANSNRETTG